MPSRDCHGAITQPPRDHSLVPGLILTLHTFGEYLDFHPHIHALVSDGLYDVHPAPDYENVLTD